MNHIHFRTLLASVAIIAASPQLSAQSAPGGVPGAKSPDPNAAVPLPPPTPLAPPPVDSALLTLRLKGGDMASVIQEIENLFEKSSKTPINVLLAPGVQEMKVPALTLRKVSWPDALNLVAVSAGCGLEQIKGEQGEVIGYRVLPAAAPIGAGYEGAGAPSSPPMIPGLENSLRPTPTAPYSRAEIPMSSLPAPGKPSRTASKPPTGLPEIQAGPGGVISFTPPSKSPSPSNVRVYGLGEITTVVKFNEVLQSLEEVLKTSGVPMENIKFAVHEKTNVLVITGEPRVHELVGQLVQALEKNVMSAELQRSRGEGMKRQMIEAEMRLESQANEKDRLQKRLNDTEAEVTRMRRELERSKPADPSKP